MKTYTLKTDFGNYKVNIETDRYRHDDSLAIELIDAKDGGPFCRLTVCIEHDIKLKDNQSFVDTNNCPWAPKFIEENGLGKSVGYTGYSGWCEYPLFEFDLDKLKQ